MKIPLLLPFIMFCITSLYAQDIQLVEREGFIFGASVGASSLCLRYPASDVQTVSAFSLPNFKFGYMVTNRTALLLYFPGSVYSYTGEGRTRDRGFEAILPSAQYWITDRWWALAGAGLGMDAPAFYDIQNEEERKFYFGGSVVLATGFELLRKGKFVLDTQGRVHYGTASLTEGTRTGIAYSILVGVNWY
ncbi:MAG: hypothetical protein ACKVPJ_09580 [Chitinophagales bacterium]